MKHHSKSEQPKVTSGSAPGEKAHTSRGSAGDNSGKHGMKRKTGQQGNKYTADCDASKCCDS